MKYFAFLLRLLLGGIFIYSAYSKLFPVELFEYTFVDTGIIPWKLAPFIARIFIGMEWLLGGWLVFGISLKKYTLKAVFGLLVFFCVYLLFQIFVKKETGNCGCFGTEIIMTPTQALLKNAVLLFITGLLYFLPQTFLLEDLVKIRSKEVLLDNDNVSKTRNLIVYLFLLLTLSTAFILPFVLNPTNIKYSNNYDNEKVNYRPPLELLYAKEQADPPKVDFTKGKWILAFLSLSCPHCKVAAFKLNVMHNKNPKLPIYFVMNGDTSELAPFYMATNAQNIPHNFFIGREYFLKLVGPSYPVIFWLNNGVVEKKSNHIELSEDEIEAWLKK